MMDTKTLLAEAKARFNHNSAKDYLAAKYNARLIVAEQGGLFKADAQTITFLSSFPTRYLVVVDTFNNPVKVDRAELLWRLQEVYAEVMEAWLAEWKEIENKR
jgi:hypothetical protein